MSMPCVAREGRRRQRVRSCPYHQQLSVQRRSPVLGPVSADHTLGPRDVASMTRSVIVSAVRTPVGKFGAGLRGCSATDLGAVAIREAVARADLPPDEVDHVLMGHVLQAGAGQITSRQAAVAAGIPQEVPALTLNNVCLSSLTAVAYADQLIRLGEIETAVAGGMESMTNAPYVLPKVRWGQHLGDAEVVDAMIHDGLWSTFTGQHMGESSDEVNAALEISREEQDAWAARSHQRAADARESGRFADEIVGVEHRARRGHPDPGRRPRRWPSSRRRSGPTARSPPATRRSSPTAPPPSPSCAASARTRSGPSRWPRSWRRACRPSGSPTSTPCPLWPYRRRWTRRGLRSATSG